MVAKTGGGLGLAGWAYQTTGEKAAACLGAVRGLEPLTEVRSGGLPRTAGQGSEGVPIRCNRRAGTEVTLRSRVASRNFDGECLRFLRRLDHP
jgi:hypothetical protein